MRRHILFALLFGALWVGIVAGLQTLSDDDRWGVRTAVAAGFTMAVIYFVLRAYERRRG